MRRRLTLWLHGIWYHGEPVPFWLAVLEWFHHLWHRLPAGRGRRAPRSAPGAAVIVIGNLTAGGSGKTPLVLHLARFFAAQNVPVGVIASGYGGSRHRARRVDPGADPRREGDESVLLARQCPGPVWAGRARAAALRGLRASSPVQVVLADDGLQHRALRRDIEICLIDGERGLGNGRLLPAGPLREPPERLAECDRVVYKGCQAPGLPLGAVMKLEIATAIRLADGVRRPLTDWQGMPVQALAAIADPDSFFNRLLALGLIVHRHAHPDHHFFTAADLARLDPEMPVLMTAKDAVKWPPGAAHDAWQVPLETVLPPSFEDWLMNTVHRLLESGQSNRDSQQAHDPARS